MNSNSYQSLSVGRLYSPDFSLLILRKPRLRQKTEMEMRGHETLVRTCERGLISTHFIPLDS